jgi:predicted secreted protein
VRVGEGQRVTIRLKENRTTGYGWVLEEAGKAQVHGEAAVPNNLRLVTDKSLPSEHKGMMGMT